MRTRHDRLNALAAICGARRYLEIGVCDGDTFAKVDVAYKVGVDPHFRFDPATRRDAHTELHALTSDAWFAQLAPGTPPFDLIFLDGLHTFEQTLRDFTSSWAIAHPATIWLLDDTAPDSELSADPSMTRSIAAKRALGLPDRGWMGDVYKVVAAIHDLHPRFRLRTFANLGQTVVWAAPAETRTPVWGSLEAISAMGWPDYVGAADTVFARSRPEAILDEVRTTLLPGPRAGT